MTESPLPARAEIGVNTIVEPGAIVGFQYHPEGGSAGIGCYGIIRLGALIYGDVSFGDYLQVGHYAVIRAHVRGGNYCAIGNHSTLEGRISLGDGVRIMSHVYISSSTRLGNHVFVGPGSIFLNDRTPGRYLGGSPLPVCGALIEDDVVIGGGCTILPGVTLGRGSFVAAGTVVTKSVPPLSFVKGVPGKAQPLPSNWPHENSRELTSAKLDLWHPLGPAPKG